MSALSNKNIVASYASFGFIGFLGVTINIFLLSFSGLDVLGRYNYTFAFLILASQFCVGGTQFSLLNHSIRFKNRKSELSFIIGSSILVCFFFSIIFAVASVLLNNFHYINIYLSQAKLNSLLFLIAIFLFSVNKIILVFINSLNLLISYAFLNALRYIFLFFVIIAFTYLNLLEGFIQDCFLVSETLLLATLLFFIIFNVSGIGMPKKRWLKRHLSFGVRGFVGGLLMEINSKVDVILLGTLLGFHAAGIYSFAAMITEGFSQVYIVIKNNIDPIFSSYLKLKKNAEISAEILKIRQIYIPILLIFGIVLICLFRFIFEWVFNLNSEVISESFPSFFILMIGILIASFYRPFVGLLIQLGKPELYSLVILISAILNILLSLTFIPYFGIEGAALSTSIAFVAESFFLFRLASIIRNRI